MGKAASSTSGRAEDSFATELQRRSDSLEESIHRQWRDVGDSDDLAVKTDEPSHHCGMPIRSYGLFWNRAEVDWKPGSGNRGAFRLLGRRGSVRPHLRLADFRSQQGLYVLHSAYGVYYVGLVRTGTLGLRLKQHLDDDHGSAWDRFSWFGFREVLQSTDQDGLRRLRKLATLQADESLSAIKDMEALLINLLNPPGNANWMNFSNAEQWTQVGKGEEEKIYRERLNS